MREKDIFKTNTWNFLQGDRQIEGLICDLPFQTNLVVRNQIPNILATIVGIKDLATFGWVEDSFNGSILAPWNAIEFTAKLEHVSDKKQFLIDYLLGLYGVETIKNKLRNRSKQLLIVMNPSQQFVEQGEQDVLIHLKQLLKSKDMITVFVLKAGQRLHTDLIPFLKRTYSSLFYNGYNACLNAGMEEVLCEIQPEVINIAGYSDLHVIYSAIGAVDYYINSDAHFRNPNSLSISDLFLLAKQVKVLENCTDWSSTSTQSYRAHLKQHLSQDLKINIETNPLFQATRESIAIDIC